MIHLHPMTSLLQASFLKRLRVVTLLVVAASLNLITCVDGLSIEPAADARAVITNTSISRSNPAIFDDTSIVYTIHSWILINSGAARLFSVKE